MLVLVFGRNPKHNGRNQIPQISGPGPAVVLLSCSGLRDSRVGEIIKESAYLKMNRSRGGEGSGGLNFRMPFAYVSCPLCKSLEKAIGLFERKHLGFRNRSLNLTARSKADNAILLARSETTEVILFDEGGLPQSFVLRAKNALRQRWRKLCTELEHAQRSHSTITR